MKLHSIQVKLSIILALGFVLTSILVVVIVQQQMTRAINLSQEAEYGERLQTILQIIAGNHERLLKTERVATYRQDFEDLTLRQLRRTFSQTKKEHPRPFIIDAEGQLLLIPGWPNGSSDLYGKILQHSGKATEGVAGSAFFSSPEQGDSWGIFRSFEPWGWTVGYLVPLKEKYQLANQLSHTLVLVFAGITLLVVALQVWLVRMQLKPIATLTETSLKMAQGQLENPLQIQRQDEIGILADNFNRMQVAIQRTIAALRQSEQRLSLALIGSDSGIWDWDLETGKVFFDENYFRISGYEPDEFPHAFEEWEKRVHPEDIDQAKANIDAYLSGAAEKFVVEFRFRTKSGQWMWILGQGMVSERDESGQPVRFTGTHKDISEKKQAEDALRRSEEKLRITLDSIGDGVIATDAEIRITRMNPVAETLTGWSSSEAIGQPIEEVFRIIQKETRKPQDNPAKFILASGELTNLNDNTLLIAKNGREFQIADSGAPIRNENGEVVGVVLVFRDVTEERVLQEQVLHSQKMETVGQLAGGVAHDFNNMLGGIIGAAELLKKRLPSEQKTDKFLGMIVDSAERAADLTRKLLAFSRKQHVESTPVDVHAALNQTLALLKNTVDRRIQIRSDLSAESARVAGDLAQLQNAFLNICLNATQAMPEGGELSISTQRVDLDQVACETSPFQLQPGPHLEIEFRDSGCGIPAENLERIFEPFFTTKEQGKGTGLGLAAVLGTVQQHHGAVTAYSEVGAGSVFHVLFPLTEAPLHGSEMHEQPVTGSGLILVVDDEAVMRATAAAILEDLGYQVLLAENGRAGLNLFQTQREKIDLVLLDMIMPELNGRDCFTEMRKIDPGIKVILSSGFAHSDDLDDLRSAGLAGFLRKPYRSVELSRSVAAAMSSGEGDAILWSQ